LYHAVVRILVVGDIATGVELAESYWPADTSEPVLETTVGGVLQAAAKALPDGLAMVAGVPDPAARRRWTYGELLSDSERVARALLGRFRPGERVAVWAPNIPEWILLEFGAGLAGMTLVTVNPAFRPAELKHVLGQSNSAGIFMVPEFRGNPMAQSVEQVRAELPELREAISIDGWEDFLASGSATETLPDVSSDDAAQIQYTSGTTGTPKGAILRHRSITNNARFFTSLTGFVEGETYVNPMPLFHTAGCCMGVLGTVQSRTTHIPVVAFEPGLVLELIESYRSTGVGGVPTMLIAMLAHPSFAGRDLNCLRYAVSGGSTVPAELVHRIEDGLKLRFYIVFGTTECAPLVSQTRAGDGDAERAETIGRPVPQTEVKVVEPGGTTTLPVGELGELCARGYMVMKGYNDMPEATADAIDSDGWYHTGDLGRMDTRGYLTIEGRLKDMIIRGGQNIYSREIEDRLFSHPDVAEVAVAGIPDPAWGETVAAFVRLSAGSAVSVEELRAYCRETLAPYKTPQQWVFVENFPLTPSGKIQKFVLRDRFVAGELRSG
jgi:fatty-acyl-CoA synthase